MSRVLVVGGSEEYVGAPFLAGIAALRAGAFSTVVMAPERVAWAINTLSPDLVTRKLKGSYLTNAHERAIRRQMKTADILVLGNGAGTRPTTAALMRSLMRVPLPKVVDADALKVLRHNEVSNAVLTPNEGEWNILQKHNDIQTILRKGNVIIKKGFFTRRSRAEGGPTKIIADSQTLSVRTNKGLAIAGTGDVLAGFVAGFMAQGLSPLAAARRACKTGNEVANLLTKKKGGNHFLASDLVQALHKVKQAHRSFRSS